MNREEFLAALASELGMLAEAERERSLAFYAEMIDDRMEGGASEEEAVASLGPVEEIAAEILGSAPIVPAVKQRNRRRLRGWEIALLIIGSPVWLPLLLAAGVVALSLLIVLWVLIAALWVATASCVLCVPMSLVNNIAALLRGNLMRSVVSVGMACVAAGLALLLLLAAHRLTRGAARLTQLCWIKLRRTA